MSQTIMPQNRGNFSGEEETKAESEGKPCWIVTKLMMKQTEMEAGKTGTSVDLAGTKSLLKTYKFPTRSANPIIFEVARSCTIQEEV